MVRILKNLFGVSRDDFGGKAEGLAWLTKVNAPIPPTLCISANQEDINTLCQNDELLSATKDWIDGLPPTEKWIVRSSHSCEDSVTTSSAGLYPSRIVEPSEQIDTLAIVKIVKDVLGELALSSSSLAVLVQPFISGSFSGVLFTSDPNVGKHREGILTFVKGPCSNLVDGSATPQAINFKDNNQPADLPFVIANCWHQLIDNCFAVENLCGMPVDCEFTIDISQNLFILQARPIASLTQWKNNNSLITIHHGVKLPTSVESHPKVKLRFQCEQKSISISPAWIATETSWEHVPSFDFSQGCYTSVLIQPRLLDGKVKRKFSPDGYSGVAEVLSEADQYWVRHAIIAEVYQADLTGIATFIGDRTLIEVAKGHFVPKGVVPTTVYEVNGDGFNLVNQPLQEWFYEINPQSGEAERHSWHGRVSLNNEQLFVIVSTINKLNLNHNDCLEFGILGTGKVFVIDVQRSALESQIFTANHHVISFGEAEGELHIIELNSKEGTKGHFFEFASTLAPYRDDLEPVVVATQRPEISLLQEFKRLSLNRKRVVAVIFEIYSPLCHLSLLLREARIPAVVIPDFRNSDLAQAHLVKVIATAEGGSAVKIN